MALIVNTLGDLALVAAILWGWGKVVPHLAGLQEGLREWPDDRIDTLARQLDEIRGAMVELDARTDQLPSTWEEMHHKVRRTEERTRAAVRRVQKELEEGGYEDEEISGLARQLQLGDGTGGPANGVRPMHGGMGQVQETPSPTPEDWRARALRQKFGG